jgi:hypothetical protein
LKAKLVRRYPIPPRAERMPINRVSGSLKRFPTTIEDALIERVSLIEEALGRTATDNTLVLETTLDPNQDVADPSDNPL